MKLWDGLNKAREMWRGTVRRWIWHEIRVVEWMGGTEDSGWWVWWMCIWRMVQVDVMDDGTSGGCNPWCRWSATQQEQHHTNWGGVLGLQQSSCIPEVMVGTKVGNVWGCGSAGCVMAQNSGGSDKNVEKVLNVVEWTEKEWLHSHAMTGSRMKEGGTRIEAWRFQWLSCSLKILLELLPPSPDEESDLDSAWRAESLSHWVRLEVDCYWGYSCWFSGWGTSFPSM